MSSIVELYRQLGMENGKKRFEVWCMEHPNSFAAKKYAMFCGVMNVDRTWGCISQFLAEALEPFDFREMEYIFGRTGAGKKINLSDLWEKKKVIFLNISDTDRYADRVANLFYTQALQVLCAEADLRNEGRLPRPVRFILDDFAANVYIEDFDKLISVIRSRNISVSVILQSLTQLQSMYSKEQADTIVTNCDHLLYLGGQDIETARYIGYRSNKTEDHILLMPIGKAYLIERGKLGIMVDRVPPYEIERQSFDKENQKDSESWYETADELIFA